MELPGELPNRWTVASRERSRAATSPSMPAGQGSGDRELAGVDGNTARPGTGAAGTSGPAVRLFCPTTCKLLMPAGSCIRCMLAKTTNGIGLEQREQSGQAPALPAAAAAAGASDAITQGI